MWELGVGREGGEPVMRRAAKTKREKKNIILAESWDRFLEWFRERGVEDMSISKVEGVTRKHWSFR